MAKKLINSCLSDEKIGNLCFFNREKYERFFYSTLKEMIYDDEAFVNYMSLYFDTIKQKNLNEEQTFEEIDMFVKSFLFKAIDCLQKDLIEELKECHMLDFVIKTEQFSIDDFIENKD